jgi:hypothetical protein
MRIFNPMLFRVRGSADSVCDDICEDACLDSDGKERHVGDVVKIFLARSGDVLNERAVIIGFRKAPDGQWWFAYTCLGDTWSSQGAMPFDMVLLR